MATVWENSHVDQLRTLFDRKGRVQTVVKDVRRAIEPLILPDARNSMASPE